MSSVSYSQASELFDKASVWVSGHEEYWYRRAWEALEKQGETAYKTQVEYYHVLLKALAIIYVYDGFCKSAFELSDNFSYYDLVDDVIPHFVLGQLVAKHSNQDDLYDEEELEYGVENILVDMRHQVFKAIGKEMTDTQIYTWMYCTGFTPLNWNAPIEDEDGTSCEFEPYEINSYEDYANMIENVEEEIISDLSMSGCETLNDITMLL